MFDVQPDNTLVGGEVFCTIGEGGPDGIRVDTEGRLYSTAEEGIRVFSPTGQLLGSIPVPETPANLCFGGEDNRTLFITARTGLYSIRLHATGAVKH